jgi:hypothetical protein
MAQPDDMPETAAVHSGTGNDGSLLKERDKKMEFRTQYNYDWQKSRLEMNNEPTIVSQVRIPTMAERAADMILAGQLIQAGKIGYQFMEGDPIPEVLSAAPDRRVDITTKLQYIERFGQKLRDDIINRINKQATDKSLQEQAAKPTTNINTGENNGNKQE